jgi:hypothetical protein
MNVKEGDILVCSGPDCDLELTVTKICHDGKCGEGTVCDITATCGDDPLVLKGSQERKAR